MSFLPVFDTPEVLLLLLEVTLKGSLVLATAGLATSLLRRSPAAVRHTIWTTAIVTVAALPAIVAYAPKYDVGVLPASERVTATPSLAPAESAESVQFTAPIDDLARKPRRRLQRAEPPVVSVPAEPTAVVSKQPESEVTIDWWFGLIMLWGAGTFLVFLRYAIGWVALHRIRKRSEPIADVRFRLAAIKVARSMGLKRRVRLVWGATSGMPLTWGFFRPTVLLPLDARQWKPQKTISVLQHELAHIKRWDCLVQTLVYVVCAIHWFNPLVWIAAANSRKEREMACDDYVIRGGTAGTAYADHLLEIARSLRTPKMAGVSTIAMARPSELEGRLMAILSEDRTRAENSRMGLFATMGLLTAVAVPLAAVRPVPVEPSAEPATTEFAADSRTNALSADVDAVAQPRNEVEFRPVDEPAPSVEPLSAPADPVVEASEVGGSIESAVGFQSVEETQAYIEQANRLMEKAAKTLESIERLQPTVSAWQAEFGGQLTESLTPLILDQIIASPDTIPLAQIKRLKAAGIDAQYIEDLASVGLTRLSIDELVSLAHAHVDADYVRELQRAGYRNLTPSELSQLAFADVEPKDIAVWAELGYGDLSTGDLIRLAHADVDAGFVMAMAKLGYRDLGPNDLARMSHADVDPEFVAEMRRAGYSGLTADELIRLGHADIGADFVREMGQYGLTNLSTEDLIRLGHADVDAWYIEAMRSSGYNGLSADDLIRMSHADVDPTFVQDLARAGYANLSPDELIRLGHADVHASFIAEMREAGMTRASADDLVRLSHAEVNGAYLAELKELGVDVNDIDEVVRLKYMNIDTEYIKQIQQADIQTDGQ